MDNYSEYIDYRIKKSYETYEDALLLLENGSWNAVVNRLYYASYYIASAFLIQHNIETKTHAGVRIQFNLTLIKSGKLPRELGELFNDLFDSRQKGDYGDMFDFERETVQQLMGPVKDFIDQVEKAIREIK
jgi:uncharacterized protein